MFVFSWNSLGYFQFEGNVHLIIWIIFSIEKFRYYWQNQICSKRRLFCTSGTCMIGHYRAENLLLKCSLFKLRAVTNTKWLNHSWTQFDNSLNLMPNTTITLQFHWKCSARTINFAYVKFLKQNSSNSAMRWIDKNSVSANIFHKNTNPLRQRAIFMPQLCVTLTFIH